MMNFLFNLLDVSPKNEEGNFGMGLERNVLELRAYKVVTFMDFNTLGKGMF